MISEKGRRWIERNGFDNNYDYTIKLLKKFKIEKYHFITDKFGNATLIITDGLNKYKLETIQENYFDKDFNRIETNSYMSISKTETHRNGQKHAKEYWVFKKKFKEDCIYSSIRWIARGSIINKKYEKIV